MASNSNSSSVVEGSEISSAESGFGDDTIFQVVTLQQKLEEQTQVESKTGLVGLETTSGSHIPEVVPWIWYKLEWEWWTIIQLITAIVGIIGNLLVMMVVFRPGLRRRSTDILIGTLALADFLTSVFVIPVPSIRQLPGTWIGQLYCKIVYINTFMWTFVTVSVHVLSVVSIERLIGIAYPLQLRKIFSNRLTVLYISIITAIDVIIHIAWSFVAFVDDEANNCVVRYPSLKLQIDVGIVLFFYKFAVPLFIMVVAQSLTAFALHVEHRKFEETGRSLNASSPQLKLLVAKRRVINLLLIVVLTFFICWGPSQIFYLLVNIGVIPFTFLYGPLNWSLIVLSFFNSCLNPFIYTVRYPRFRESLADLFLGASSSKKNFGVFGAKE